MGQEAILALLLDYDGTLSPIAPHPDLATIPPETKKVLKQKNSAGEGDTPLFAKKKSVENWLKNSIILDKKKQFSATEGEYTTP